MAREDDETLLAAAAIVQGLARDLPSIPPPFTKHGQATNGCEAAKIKLPGGESDSKAALERELSSLISRVNTLQSFVVSLVCSPSFSRLFKNNLFMLFFLPLYSPDNRTDSNHPNSRHPVELPVFRLLWLDRMVRMHRDLGL